MMMNYIHRHVGNYVANVLTHSLAAHQLVSPLSCET